MLEEVKNNNNNNNTKIDIIATDGNYSYNKVISKGYNMYITYYIFIHYIILYIIYYYIYNILL